MKDLILKLTKFTTEQHTIILRDIQSRLTKNSLPPSVARNANELLVIFNAYSEALLEGKDTMEKVLEIEERSIIEYRQGDLGGFHFN